MLFLKRAAVFIQSFAGFWINSGRQVFLKSGVEEVIWYFEKWGARDLVIVGGR